ncbi:MAG: ABC transporter ATP-binding protein [Cytophagales bacterium]|nr:lipoprotein-releasing system ATP-binding protein LolD [Flammeovirgaceae bacterium]PDH44607.1 MAG: lipoprotein-releasing system ATP-binding protein LolD [Rhodothermaeota bacterium MED-G18]|tara:strand:+ start:2098 stop:2754 length:657 start_codon:yes stop_codon:yes gene_type:complete
MLVGKNVSKSFGDLKILQNINLKFKLGNIISIFGGSGAGKSTLLYILSTLEKPDSGSIEFNGNGLTKLSGDNLSNFRNENIGFVFQSHNLLNEFNVFENICMPAYVSQTKSAGVEKRARQLLYDLGIEDKEKNMPNQLSGGEQQRVAIARSLINSPDIIFADEPTGNLDEKNSKKFIKLIQILNKKYNQTFIIVTHNKEFQKISNNSFELKNGKLNSI